MESVHLLNIKDVELKNYSDDDVDIKMIDSMLNVIDMIRNIRDTNMIQLKKPLKQIIIYGEDSKLELLKKVENYILAEGNIIENISWQNWEAPTYNYKYTIINSFTNCL